MEKAIYERDTRLAKANIFFKKAEQAYYDKVRVLCINNEETQLIVDSCLISCDIFDNAKTIFIDAIEEVYLKFDKVINELKIISN